MNRISNVIKIGGFAHLNTVNIGGDHPVVIQTMYKDKLSFNDLNDDLVLRIETLGEMGCGLLRFAVPDMQSADIVGRLAGMVSMPLVADIHFDYKIALRCMDFPIAKIRINPGNIGSKDKVKAVLEKAAAGKIPIRIGVNAGSLPQDLRRVDLDTDDALVLAAEREIEIFEEFGFTNYLVSMKSSTIADTINVNRILSQRTAAPLHLGVTEAGPLISGVTGSAAALVPLLTEGIGDTIRVSLSDTIENEVIAGREILRAAAELQYGNARLKHSGVKLVSCPRCGRAGFDTHAFTERWLARLYAVKNDLTVAIMGCKVNGPGEAIHADLGITGVGDIVLIFKHGKVIKTINTSDADAAFEEELNKLEMGSWK